MTTRLAHVLSTTDLPLAELCSARLDGELYALGDGWCPIDQPGSASARAEVAAMLVPAGVIADRLTAAWILGTAPEPGKHQFCVDTAARMHVQPSARFQLREARNIAADTQLVGGLRITTAKRTVIELARTRSPVDGAAATAGRAGAGQADDLVSVIAALLDLFPEVTTATLAGHPLLAHGRQFATLAWQRIDQARALLLEGLAVAHPIHVVDGVNAPYRVQHAVKVGGVPHLEDEPAECQSVA